MPEKEFLKAYKSNPRLRTKVNNFHKQASSSNNADDEFVPIRPDWTTVDRIIACRCINLLDPLDVYLYILVLNFGGSCNFSNLISSIAF